MYILTLKDPISFLIQIFFCVHPCLIWGHSDPKADDIRMCHNAYLPLKYASFKDSTSFNHPNTFIDLRYEEYLNIKMNIKEGVNFIIIYIRAFYTHLGYSSNFTLVCHCQVIGGTPPPSGDIVCENQSTRSKTTLRSKRVGPLGSNGDPTVLSFYWCLFHLGVDTH